MYDKSVDDRGGSTNSRKMEVEESCAEAGVSCSISIVDKKHRRVMISNDKMDYKD